ncbi:hypothetical protein V2J09_011172 [Rumex salicifolius]
MADPTELHSVSQENKLGAPHHRRHKETHGRSDNIDETTSVEDVKGPSVFERVKEEMEAIVQAVHPKKEQNVKDREANTSGSSRHSHHHETHGRCDDIDETTSVDEVKGPSVLERMKEEVEAVVEAIHPKKKDSDGHK